MSHPLFQKLEAKIDQALETIELLRLQLEESEEKCEHSLSENSALKNKQQQWENSLSALLRKLENSDLTNTLEEKEMRRVEAFEEEAVG